MTALTYFIYIIGGIIGWITLYYIIKTAVKNGIIEARINNENTSYITERKPEIPINSEQIKLKKLYDNNEITFEAYQSEWEKLK